MAAGNVECDRVLLADVLAVRLAARAVEDDHAGGSGEAYEEIVLAALVVVQPANDPSAGEGDVRLQGRLRQRALASDLREPAALVLETPHREAKDSLDHWWFAP